MCPQDDERGRQASLQPAWRPDADEGPHQEAQVEAADVNEQPLQNIGMPAQMGRRIAPVS